MPKEEKQLQQAKEELTAEELKGVDGAEGIFQTLPPASEQEQLDAELAQEGGMMGGIWTINSGAGVYRSSTPNIYFLSSVDTRKEEGLTLALLFLYAFKT